MPIGGGDDVLGHSFGLSVIEATLGATYLLDLQGRPNVLFEGHLTGNCIVTVGNIKKGVRVVFVFTQDATGGWVPSLDDGTGAVAMAIDPTPLSSSSFEAVSDGTNLIVTTANVPLSNLGVAVAPIAQELGNLGATQVMDFTGQNDKTIEGTLNANLTVTLSNMTAGDKFQVLAIQDATGGRTVTLSYNGSTTVADVDPAPNAQSVIQGLFTGTEPWITRDAGGYNYSVVQALSAKGQANGYAGLDSGGHVPVAQLASGTPDGTKFVADDGTLRSADLSSATAAGASNKQRPHWNQATGHLAWSNPWAFYVTDYGVAWNGTTDDTTKVQQCLDDAAAAARVLGPPGCIVVFPSGIGLVGNLKATGWQKWQGVHSVGTRLLCKPGTVGPWIREKNNSGEGNASGASGIQFVDIEFNANGQPVDVLDIGRQVVAAQWCSSSLAAHIRVRNTYRARPNTNLAASITNATTTITLSSLTLSDGSTLPNTNLLLRINGELITATGYTGSGPYTLTGVSRGTWGSTATAALNNAPVMYHKDVATLSAGIDTTQTTIPLTSTTLPDGSAVPSVGRIYIGGEVIDYNGISGTTLQNCARQSWSTFSAPAAARASGAPVQMGPYCGIITLPNVVQWHDVWSLQTGCGVKIVSGGSQIISNGLDIEDFCDFAMHVESTYHDLDNTSIEMGAFFGNFTEDAVIAPGTRVHFKGGYFVDGYAHSMHSIFSFTGSGSVTKFKTNLGTASYAAVCTGTGATSMTPAQCSAGVIEEWSMHSSRRLIAGSMNAQDGVATKYLSGASKTTVVDGDFTIAPVDGTMCIHRDTTASKTYVSVRAAGAWTVIAGPL